MIVYRVLLSFLNVLLNLSLVVNMVPAYWVGYKITKLGFSPFIETIISLIVGILSYILISCLFIFLYEKAEDYLKRLIENSTN